ncbi:MAG: NAD(P)/FAD-dependent oxidoreductase [Oscillospiraceae bacterium]|nr:NAD(P)/FAD-dependent oxidoreductase [Oscillospiraceae bacterium]
MKCDVIVIGGGPAGMMASIAAAESGARVVLLEPNSRLGKKLNITGKGRCNLTNNCPPAELMQNIPRNSRFLYSAFSQMNSQDVIAFFEGLGVPVKTERGNRVFPVSDRSFDVSAALERRLKELGVVILRDRASGLLQKDSRLTGVRGERETYTAPCAVVATGGLSYPLTGSTGDGYRLSEEAGHTVTSLRGSLVPLEEEGSVCAALQGLSLRNVRLTVLEEGRSIFTDFGELLFTHFGLSGPLVLSASAHMRDFEEKRYTAVIDLKPALDQQQLDRRILADFEKYRNSDFVNALNDLLPHKFINVFVEHSRIPPRCKVHSVTREQRQGMAALLKAFPIPIRGPRPVEEAIITAGGVAVEEINPSTMESKKLPGLYFAGEVIDVDAYTGGFNLQIAWATGYVAGQHAAWASQG